MRYGIISDIHSNLEALEAVIQAFHQMNVQRILCLGDIVGYGANPKECLSFLREVKSVSVAGNHDWAVSGKMDASYFVKDGLEAVAMNRTCLSFEDFEFLSTLPLTYKNQDLVMSHGTLHTPERFLYLDKIPKAEKTMDLMDRAVYFAGHTHIPRVYIKEKEGDFVFDLNLLEFEINPDCTYIINVGSVGQPRDGNPLACCCLYDTDLRMIELKRIKYDVASAQKKILNAGLPESLAQRLEVGR